MPVAPVLASSGNVDAIAVRAQIGICFGVPRNKLKCRDRRNLKEYMARLGQHLAECSAQPVHQWRLAEVITSDRCLAEDPQVRPDVLHRCHGRLTVACQENF